MLYRVVHDTYATLELVGRADEVDAYFDRHPEEILENSSDIPYVVFILNESIDRNRMSLYGCTNPTTQFRDQRSGQGELTAFTDTIACANGTGAAMKLIFTFANKDDTDLWYHHANVIDVLKQAGYKTHWLSNQNPAGYYGNMDKIFGDRCADREFTMTSGGASGEKAILDEALFPLLDQRLAQADGNKQFILLHLYGAHEPYQLRYPENEAVFTAEDEEGEEERWREVKAQYDNAVLYDDKVVDQIIQRFEDKDAIIVEISDHGNEVYDGRNFMGHSSEQTGNRHMIEVPFVVWTSKQFREKRPELVARIRAAADRPFRTDDMIHVLLDMMSIHTTSYDPTRSVINEAYLPRPRIYSGKEYQKQD